MLTEMTLGLYIWLVPNRWSPTRLLCPWDSLGKNTGVGCHFLLQCMKVESEVAQLCPTLSNLMDYSLQAPPSMGFFQARVLEWGAIAFSNYSAEITLNRPSIFFSLVST